MPQSLFHRLPEGAPAVAMPEEARPFLGAMLNAAGCGVAFLDRELRPVWVNAALAALSGMSAHAHLGRPLGELWPQVAPVLFPLLARALAGEDVVEAPVSGPLESSGRERHLRVGTSPALQGGVLAGVVLWVRDETERVHEAQRLREREAHMRGLADVSCDGYFLHEGGIVLDANRALATLMGHASVAELIGRRLTDWVAPEFRAMVAAVMSRGVETPYEVVCVRADGQRLPLEVLGRTVTWEGRQVRLAGVWDISSRKAAEERAARVEHFRDQFLGVIGTELRTPLQSIQLGTGALQRLGGLEESQRRLVGHMAQAARRMERMIHELVDFTRARLSGGLAVRPEPGVLDSVVRRVVEERRLAHPGRTLLLETEGDLRGQWDAPRLAQLADNLLGSVLQHGPEDAPVAVKLAGVVGGVTLSVHHDGLVVPAEEHAALFEPFRQGRPSSPDGLGLGLYIARQIALAHGGRLHVESRTGGGVRFIVWLPREASAG
ncbi:PAS domain-containing sensor histidine kinase [Pyxidicoccus xibeiensis]|uniref:PAS domain-containing sensor histidine kinase n=1 Tax=Pyxidicoccus xibeiensis TaxID=2906759 RepID=UPI0020A781FF|nr:PAS domain-containing protein [Pyxidicoccus xibeiensis]MCP3140000.1 PAS domain-containing protein [Pyxidicoccus xibeiensis]